MSERTKPPPESPRALTEPTGGAAEPGSLAWILERQCRLAPAEGGVIFRWAVAQPAPDVMAIHPRLPDGATAPQWAGLAVRAVERLRGQSAGAAGAGVTWSVLPVEEQASHPRGAAFVVAHALPSAQVDAAPELFGAFLVRGQRGDLAVITERLAAGWTQAEVRELRTMLSREGARVRQSALVLELAGALAEETRFKALGTALCDRLAARLSCERVALGLGTGSRHTGRSIKVRAMSHAEKIVPGAQAVQDIELVMEECLDQDADIACPAPAGEVGERPGGWIDRAAREHSARNESRCLLSLPIRTRATLDDDPVTHIPGVSADASSFGTWRSRGVLTLERDAARPFTTGEMESLRALLDIVAPHLVHMAQRDRWIGARAAASARSGLATLLGPRHTWLKLAALGLLGLAAFLALAKGTYRVEASFRLEAIGRQVIPAPFDSFLRQADLRVGDMVVAGETVLARLDDTQLRLQLAESRAEMATHLKELAVARQEGKIADEQIAKAQADKIQARVELLEYQISQATIVAPISGTIVTGDLQKMRGAPVQTGHTLFEIAPIDALRAEISVPEDQIGDVRVGQTGRLATAALPESRIGLSVERIDPVAEVVDEKNVFRIRARLSEIPEWMRPGMEGVAKIDVDQRLYSWIWSRRLVNWVRMKLWF